VNKALIQVSRSPYAIGAGLGVLSSFAFATVKRGLGVTTAFESAAALTSRAVAPRATHVNEFVKEADEVPRIDWESMLVGGMVAGSYATARIAGDRDTGVVPTLWRRRFGPSTKKRYAGAILGGALMMFGARMAKGCTSGHGLTGCMQLAVSSWVFTPLMFASAALTARALFGKGTK
jgi:hypothetical protein